MRPICLLFALATSLFAQAPVAPLVGTVLDPDGKPAKDAVITVARCDGRLFCCLDLQLRDEWVEVARTRTDKMGRFGLQVPLGLALRVEVDLPPFARWIHEAIVPGENQEVRLEAACGIAGQLLDAATGVGTPGALRAWNPQTRVQLFAGRTDNDGRFRFERLPSGRYCCDVEPDTHQCPDWPEQGTLAPGEQQNAAWKCSQGSELTGQVTDADTGKPLAGARVGEGWTFDKAVRTDAAGRYTLRGFGGSPVVGVHVDAPGYERVRIDRDATVPGPFTQDVALRLGGRVVGRLVDEHGRAIAMAYVAAIATTGAEVPWLATRSDADGGFVCDGFPRRCEGVLMVRRAGFASVVYSLPRPAGDGQIDFGKVTLRAPLLVRGVVLDKGRPAANVEVSLRGVNADMAWLAPMPATWGFLRHYCGERQVRTDANGNFAFGDVAAGDYTVAIGSLMDASPDLEYVTVTAGVDVPPLKLVR